MDSRRSLVPTRHHDGRLVVTRYLDPDTIAHRVAPLVTVATLPLEASRITEVIQAHDLQARARHLILVHRLDSRRVRDVGNVVVFSEPCYAAFRAEDLQLATPAYYREHEKLEEDIRDPQDGTLTMDGTPWARTIAGPGARAEFLYRSVQESWVYCAAHYHLNSELRVLKAEFAKRGYTAVTAIPEPAAFARWLGIEFALTLDKRNAATLEAKLGRFMLTAHCPDIDSVVLVHHGPVHYEDRSGSIATQEDSSNPNAGPRPCFTKKLRFKYQSEYRFAVSPLFGAPAERKQLIRVSQELRELCHENISDN